MAKLNPEKLKKRQEFVRLAYKDKKKAAQILREKAMALENCHDSSDVLFALQDILFCHRNTVLRDYE